MLILNPNNQPCHAVFAFHRACQIVPIDNFVVVKKGDVLRLSSISMFIVFFLMNSLVQCA